MSKFHNYILSLSLLTYISSVINARLKRVRLILLSKTYRTHYRSREGFMKAKFIFLTVNLLFIGEMLGAAIRVFPENHSAITCDEVATRGLLVFLERANHQKAQLMEKNDLSAEGQSLLRRYITYIDTLKSEIISSYNLYMTFLQTSATRIKEKYSYLAAKEEHTDEEIKLSEFYDKELDRFNEEMRRVRVTTEGLGMFLENSNVFRPLRIETCGESDAYFEEEEGEGSVCSANEDGHPGSYFDDVGEDEEGEEEECSGSLNSGEQSNYSRSYLDDFEELEFGECLNGASATGEVLVEGVVPALAVSNGSAAEGEDASSLSVLALAAALGEERSLDSIAAELKDLFASTSGKSAT